MNIKEVEAIMSETYRCDKCRYLGNLTEHSKECTISHTPLVDIILCPIQEKAKELGCLNCDHFSSPMCTKWDKEIIEIISCDLRKSEPMVQVTCIVERHEVYVYLLHYNEISESYVREMFPQYSNYIIEFVKTERINPTLYQKTVKFYTKNIVP